MNDLIICFIIDNNLINHIKIVIQSILRYSSIPVHFCILTDDISTQQNIHTVMSDILIDKNYDIFTLNDADKNRMKEIYIPESRTDLTYFIYSQLYLPHYVSKYKKFLFMEPDQIVQKDLATLWKKAWKEDIKLAAVKSNAGEITLDTLRTMYPTEEIKTFNAGVVLVDTEYWNNNNFTDLCVYECLKQKELNGTRYNFYQEGAMNLALQKYFIELDKSYNCMDLGWRQDLIKGEINNAIILHWNGNKKPWLECGLYKEYYTL
jgi:lipopolysaccharide biosynthesis glycosyltransferase